MSYSTEDNAVVIFDMLLTFISRVDFSDRQTIDALKRRVNTAGMSKDLRHMALDLIEYVHEIGVDG